MHRRSLITFGSGSLVVLLGAFLLVTASSADSDAALPAGVVGAATVSVPPPPAPVVASLLDPGTAASEPTTPVNTLPYFPVDPPAPTVVTSATIPVAPSTAAAPVVATTTRPSMAAGTAPANTFAVAPGAVRGQRPRAWIVRNLDEARAGLGTALPTWVEQFPFERHGLAVMVLDSARQRVGCSVLRVSWARAGRELAVAPHTACFSGSDTSGGDPAVQPDRTVTVVAIALPGATLDGVTLVTTP